MNRDVPAANPKTQRRVVVMGVDGLPGDWVVHEVTTNPQFYPNLRRFLEGGTWVKNSVPPLPSLSVTGLFTITGGQPPGGPYGHKISAFHWVNRQEGWYRDMISLQFLQKDQDYRNNGGESFFADYPNHRTAGYGFYNSDGADDVFNIESHGGMEVGLHIRPEPYEIANWRERKGGADYDVGLFTDRLTHIRAEIRNINDELSSTPKTSPRYEELLEELQKYESLEVEYSELLKTAKVIAEKNWNLGLEYLDEANLLLKVQGCEGENFTDDFFDGKNWVPIYQHQWPTPPLITEMSERLEDLISANHFFDKRPILIGDKTKSLQIIYNQLQEFLPSVSLGKYDKARWNYLLRWYYDLMHDSCTAVEDRKIFLQTSLPAQLDLIRRTMFRVITTFSSYKFDFLLHQYGVYSQENINEVREHIEPYIGDIFQIVEFMGFDGPVYFILLSDHGAMTTKNIFFMSDILHDRFGLKIKRLSSLEGESMRIDPFTNPRDVFGYDALVASTGGGYISLDMSIL